MNRFKSGLNGDPEAKELEERLKQLPFKKTADDVGADFLTGLLHQAKCYMLSKGYKPECGDQVNFIITVPAMWTLKGRQLTHKALDRARHSTVFHIGSLKLCLEPTAQAAYMFRVSEQINLKV